LAQDDASNRTGCWRLSDFLILILKNARCAQQRDF
jgi:hypothetical protein